MEKALLSLKEFCEYLGIGQTKAREILRAKECTFSVQIGNRWYANKRLLDDWLEDESSREKNSEKVPEIQGFS